MILVRYPAGECEGVAPGFDRKMASTARRKVGYHDDSFAWATLDTGRKGDEWFYMTLLHAAGQEAVDKWKTRPIGGEIRPEAWGKVFDEKPGVKEIQDFRRCVQETHVTWLMDSGMFDWKTRVLPSWLSDGGRLEKKKNPARWQRAEEEVRRMGYEFHVAAVSMGEVTAAKLPVVVELENRGVAPFYYDWPVEFGLIAEGKVVKRFPGSGKLTGLLPGDPVRLWKETLDMHGLAAGKYRLAVQAANSLPNGNAIRFANKTQDADVSGWLTLGEVRLR